jgi:hypothetical protein
MLTVGVFMFKDRLTSIFESWGILGTILLVIMAATIPYGLCRGFGLSAGKAFFLSYILIYILSWVKFAEFYKNLANHNLGLINLGLLILFFVSIFKLIKFPKFPSLSSKNLEDSSPFRSQIDQEMREEIVEGEMIANQAEKMTKIEIHSIEDIAKVLAEIQNIIETHRNNLSREERNKIAGFLKQISKDEDIFIRDVKRIQKLIQRLGTVDAQHLRELKERLGKTTGEKRKIIKAEIEGEEEKLKIEQTILELEKKLTQALNSFNQYIKAAIEHIRDSPYPYDGIHPLFEAKRVLTTIFKMIKETRQFEEQLENLAKTEKKLLKKERVAE